MLYSKMGLDGPNPCLKLCPSCDEPLPDDLPDNIVAELRLLRRELLCPNKINCLHLDYDMRQDFCLQHRNHSATRVLIEYAQSIGWPTEIDKEVNNNIGRIVANDIHDVYNNPSKSWFYKEFLDMWKTSPAMARKLSKTDVGALVDGVTYGGS